MPPLEEGLPRLAGSERDDREVRFGGDGVSFRRAVLLRGNTADGPVGAAYPPPRR
jgi:hypothetical protein